MSRFIKYSFMTVITLALAWLCIILPQRISTWTDQNAIGKVNLENLPEINVEINERMTMLEKLDLLNDDKKYLNGIDINQGKNFKNEEEAYENCKKEISRLNDLGIIKLKNYAISKELGTSPITFFISPDDPVKSMILWKFSLTIKNGIVLITMDDETGKILQILAKRNQTVVNSDKKMKKAIKSLVNYLGVEVTNIKLKYLVSKEKAADVTLKEEKKEIDFEFTYNNVYSLYSFRKEIKDRTEVYKKM